MVVEFCGKSKMASTVGGEGGADSFPVKLEITAEDFLDDEFGPVNKRSRLSPSTSSSLQWSSGNDEISDQSLHYNPLDEPGPLGLRLKKSPSLLDLIQMKISQGSSPFAGSSPAKNLNCNKKDGRGPATSSAIDKLKVKASNFVASLLRIGNWEFVSRYEGDLVAKCYFHKSKLVWEVLEGGLKSKIEIQWSDIMGLKAECPDDGPGTLTVVVSRPPLFFRETNPQPRKHTLWQAASDFTGGQASTHRQHFLQCPPGLLSKHFEKLIQRDNRLKFLSQQPEMVMDSPHFDTQASHLENCDVMNATTVSSQLMTRGTTTSISSLTDGASPITELSSLTYEQQWDTASPHLSMEAPSPSSGMGNGERPDSKGLKSSEQLKVKGLLNQSMSMTDLVSHIGNRISEKVTAGSIPCDKVLECQDMLDNISQILLGDTQTIQDSDERSLMKRVNSLCCLLQDPVPDDTAAPPSNLQQQPVHDNRNAFQSNPPPPPPFHHYHDMHERQANNINNNNNNEICTQQSSAAAGLSRKDSFGDLLLQLPRITSLSKFLFDIAEDDAGDEESKER